MDTTKLIEEARRVAAQAAKQSALDSHYAPCTCSAPPRGHTTRQHDYRRLQVDELRAVLDVVERLTAALKASEERAEKAEERARQQDGWAENIAAVAEQTNVVARECIRERDALSAANLAANKRIVELEQELSEEQQLTEDASRLVVGCLDALGANIAKMAAEPYDAEKLNALRRGIPDRIRALRAELARLTTPRPIVEAPRDGTWVLLPFSTSKWDACRGPSPQYVTARWFAAAWADPNGALLTEPSHYLPLPDVKP